VNSQWIWLAFASIACAGAVQASEDLVATDFNEAYRPQFHFTARKNWLNDPNGLVFYRGEYHLFFQHNPRGTAWGNMTWGHAISKDLVHWAQLDNAIVPDALGAIYSGSAVVDWQNTAGFATGKEKPLVCIYTAAGNPFTQCLAYSTDRGRTFAKYDRNPVLPHIVGSNRDPKVVWHEPTKKWIMALFKNGSTYAFFASPDLKSWTHLHDLNVPGCGECPDFFPMLVDGDKGKPTWVFTGANGRYLIGRFDGRKYTPEAGPFLADVGANYYAVQTYSDIPEKDGRRIQLAWMNGGRYPGMPFNQQMSFPCELTLRTCPEGVRMFRYPVKELERLRGKESRWKNTQLTPGENLLAGLSRELFDIDAEIEPDNAAEVGFVLRGAAITYDVAGRRLAALGRSAVLEPVGGKIQLRILLDRTSIEVFGNGGKVSATSCFLPKPDNRSLEILAKGGAAKVVSMKVYELRSAWPAAEPRP
jgi:fructan beta-fructosidase